VHRLAVEDEGVRLRGRDGRASRDVAAPIDGTRGTVAIATQRTEVLDRAAVPREGVVDLASRQCSASGHPARGIDRGRSALVSPERERRQLAVRDRVDRAAREEAAGETGNLPLVVEAQGPLQRDRGAHAAAPARPVHGTAAIRSATLDEGRKESSSWQNASYRPYGLEKQEQSRTKAAEKAERYAAKVRLILSMLKTEI